MRMLLVSWNSTTTRHSEYKLLLVVFNRANLSGIFDVVILCFDILCTFKHDFTSA